MPVGIVDIAKRLKISHTTVSRVINNRAGGFVSDKTRQRVLKIAREMNYRPNPLALAFRGAKTNTLGIVVPGFFKQIDRVEQMVQDAGYRVHMAAHHRSPSNLRRVIEDFAFHNVDGILINSLVEETAQIIRESAPKKPVVLCVEEAVAGFDCFIDARHQAAKLAVEYLAEQGHRRIGLVVNHTLPQMRWRKAGYLSGLQNLGLPFDENLLVDMPNDVSSTPRGYVGMKEALGRWSIAQRPTAVLCTNDEVATGVLAAAAEFGVEVPKDLSVMGMANLDGAPFARVPLTTVDWNIVGLIAKGAKRLMQRIEMPDLEPTVEMEVPHIVERKSVTRIDLG